MERALARDKGVEITELRAKHATINELNDEMLRKLQEEKNKFDKLKYEHIVLTEKLKEMNITLKDDIEYNKATEANMKALQATVDKLDINVTKNSEILEAEEIKKKAAMLLNRKHLQVKSALIAKETFIEENYDYCKHPKSLDLAFFEKIKAENNHVSLTNFLILITFLGQHLRHQVNQPAGSVPGRNR